LARRANGSEAVKMIAAFLIPHKLFTWRKSRMRERAGERYGSLRM
jgi:hypothetical protein